MINIDRSIDVLRDVTEEMHQAVNQRESGMFAMCDDGLSYQVFLTGIQSMTLKFLYLLDSLRLKELIKKIYKGKC